MLHTICYKILIRIITFQLHMYRSLSGVSGELVPIKYKSTSNCITDFSVVSK